MALKVSESDLLREAVRDQHPNETFEKALGRIVRKHGGTFGAYMELISRVRERAGKDRTELTGAATAMADEAE